eukprot:4812891-Amphidinium_carterae.1
MSWFAATFWTFDLILNFTVGYHHAGEFILTQPEILLNYLRTSTRTLDATCMTDLPLLFFDSSNRNVVQGTRSGGSS